MDYPTTTTMTIYDKQNHKNKVIREMEGTIQLKKYRTMRRRYGEGVDTIGETSRIAKSIGDIMLSSKWKYIEQ